MGIEGVVWDQNTLAREEGGLGIMDSKALYEVVVVRDAMKLWEENGSAWAIRMNLRYIKDRFLKEILHKVGNLCE